MRFLLIDPKRIELSLYEGIPHLLHPVVFNPKEATIALHWAVGEMERRYAMLSDLGARNIEGYNQKAGAKKSDPRVEEGILPRSLPYLVIVIDELADLMLVSSRDTEEYLIRLAQKARASGIHLMVATQRPSVDVITGLIKANFPTRVSYQVSARMDSRVILDVMGAERLLGMGDLLFMPPGTSRLKRIHGPFVSEEEVTRVVDFLKVQATPQYEVGITELQGAGEEDGGKRREGREIRRCPGAGGRDPERLHLHAAAAPAGRLQPGRPHRRDHGAGRPDRALGRPQVEGSLYPPAVAPLIFCLVQLVFGRGGPGSMNPCPFPKTTPPTP